MTTNTTTRCRTCGAGFQSSATGYTVRCPDCRASRRQPAVPASMRTVTCACGKTVVSYAGRPTGSTCPRSCETGQQAGAQA